jgi:AcrR family transcriptional regulator
MGAPSGSPATDGDQAPASATRQLTEQGRERKQQLIDAAMELFAQRGFAATRISDICERAGVAKGLVYWYFPTKADLFSELVRTMRQRLRRAQADAMQPDQPATERIRAGTRASVRFIAEHAPYFALVQVERSDESVVEALRETSRVYRDDVAALVREAQAAGEIPDRDADLLALGVLGAVSSFSNAHRTGHTDMNTDDLAEFVGDWVVAALTG